MIDNEPSTEDMLALWHVVSKYINDTHISCEEEVIEDRVYESSPELIYEMCEIVGYYDYDD